MWAIARYDLRLTDDDFWKLDLAQFHALVKRYNRDQEILDLRTGMIASTLANIFDGKRHDWTPDDFRVVTRKVEPLGPSMDAGELPATMPPATMELIETINRAWGGVDTRERVKGTDQ